MEIQNLIKEIEVDNTSGASEFIDKVLEIIKIKLKLIVDPHVEMKNEIIMLSKQIIALRPSMATLINTIGYLIHDLDDINKILIKERLNKFSTKMKKKKEYLESNFNIFLKK
ncbi:MAG: hypothetical protein ACW99L_18820, partial [Promethearchaeota archaeon]